MPRFTDFVQHLLHKNEDQIHLQTHQNQLQTDVPEIKSINKVQSSQLNKSQAVHVQLKKEQKTTAESINHKDNGTQDVKPIVAKKTVKINEKAQKQHEAKTKEQKRQVKNAIKLYQEAINGNLTIHRFNSLKLKDHPIEDKYSKLTKVGTTAINAYATKDGHLIDPRGKGSVYKFGNKDFFNKFKKEVQFDKNGLVEVPINGQGLIQIKQNTDAPNKKAIAFMAGPNGSKIDGQSMMPGEKTGLYVLDDQSYKDMQDDFNGNIPHWFNDIFDIKNDQHIGINTYVDPKSKLDSERHFPRYTRLYNSKLSTKNTWPKYENQVYVVNATLKDSDISAKDEYCLENVNMNHVKTKKPMNVFLNNSKFDHINIEDTLGTFDSNLIGGTYRHQNDIIRNSTIKQNAKSIVDNCNITDSYISKDDFKQTDLSKSAAKESSNILKNTYFQNTVIHSSEKNSVVVLQSQLTNALAINGLTMDNSRFNGTTEHPIVLDNVIARRTNIQSPKITAKYNRLLPPMHLSDDLVLRGDKVSVLNTNTKAAQSLNHHNRNGLFINIKNTQKIIADAFQSKNCLSKEQKSQLLEEFNRSNSKVKDITATKGSIKQNESDPTDDL